MKLDLGGRRAIVAGGSRGIGFATALAFAQAGVSVSICARNAEGLENARLSLARTGATIHAMPCDMSDPAAIETYVSSAAEALGGIDILVNNCTGQSSGNTEEDWAKVIAVDLMGTVRATAAARIHLEKSGDGRVIKAGYTRANGNYVFIQHGSRYVTRYLHLNKRKVKQGQKVVQSQVIGTVGSTGAATGPHLHYEFLMDGVHRDPRKIHKQLPKAKTLAPSEMTAFRQATNQSSMQLAALRTDSHLAMNNQGDAKSRAN